MRFRPWRSVFALVTVLLVAAGCAEERPPISQVQAGVVAKSTFEGEWYYLQTVIDTPFSAGYTFVGEQGPLEKIRWEVQEDYLIARRTYEHIAGGEPEGLSGSTSASGAAVAMFAIESHFDIRRAYNPTTGEELNVIVENTTDRPWNEREFMRVDWSQNLITNNEFLVLARLFDGIEMEPVSYYVQDEDDPDAPRFEADPETGETTYIDIVSKMFVRPTEVDIPGFGALPSCYLLYQSHLDCAPGEITVRNSFLRVAESDYQPMLYTGDRMERFGYFVTERAGYDEDYGLVEPARYRFANRHNLWQASHRRDEAGELLRCTADAECDDGRGSVCDLDLARARRTTDEAGHLEGACTIPYRDREVRPMTYYTSSNFPEELVPDARHFAAEWNGAFEETVDSLRENECLRTGGEPDSCRAERDREDAGRAFVLCTSPVVEGEDPACGPVGTEARIGDLRYSLIGWVNEPHLSSPLGYGPSAADPETGEIVMGNAFVYGAGLERLATFARDLIALLLGDLDPSSVITGENVEAWIESMTAPGSEMTGMPASDHVVPVDGESVERVEQAMDFSWARLPDSPSHANMPRDGAEMIEMVEAARSRLLRAGAFGGEVDAGGALLGRLVGTDIEQMMTSPDHRLAAGLDPALPVDDAVLELASPLRGMSLENRRALDRMRDQIGQDQCVLGAEFADPGLLGLARAIARAVESGDGTFSWYGQTYDLTAEGGIDYDLVRSMLRHPIFDAVTAHEVGHTLGLRHNFSGSYDALNYNPRYWELRDDGDMRPRAWDPMTEEEIDGRIRELQYSTVMDYGQNFVVTDAEGIGHYDRAAIKMGYGDLVEVFDDTASARTVAWINLMGRLGWPVAIRESLARGLTAHTYTEWPTILRGRENIEARADVPYTSLVPQADLAAQGIDEALVDAQGRPAVPYMFCSDEQADLNPDCMRYDAGADPYESVQSVADTYWSYYIFDSFRRERLGFDADAVAGRVQSRYLEKLQRANQIYVLYRGIMEELWGDLPGFDQFWTREDGMGAWTAAAGAAFDMLTRVIVAPEPGEYAILDRPDGTEAFLVPPLGTAAGLQVDLDEGRYLETTWNFDAGYYWFDQLERVGFFYDKVIALETLVDPTTYFIGRDTDSDIRRYQINFASNFGEPVTALMRGLLGEDWGTVAPRVAAGEVRFPDALDLATGESVGVPLDPNASFSIQLFAAVLGMVYIPQTYDQDFLNESRVFVEGGPESVVLDPDRPRVSFTDPGSGLTYVAASYRDEGQERGVGAQILDRANLLLARSEDESLTDARREMATRELASYVDIIDMMRRLSWLLGPGGQPY